MAASLVVDQAWQRGIAPADVASAAAGLLGIAPQPAPPGDKLGARLPSQPRSCPAPEGLAMSNPTSPHLAEAINAMFDRRALWRQG